MLKPNLNLPTFGLSEENVCHLDERTLVIRKWNWDYQLALEFQRFAVKVINEIPRLRILICCNHPRVFTNGRGLQRPRKGEVLELKEFRSDEFKTLPFPLYQIERGGGLTFHHPGQFIFYPLLKLNPATLSLSKMTDEIFNFSAEILMNWGLKDLSHEHKFMGLWLGERKMASMGIAIQKLTTFHGMALNLLKDEEMSRALLMMNPCGLSSSTYLSAEEVISLPKDALNKFTDEFLQKVADGWK